MSDPTKHYTPLGLATAVAECLCEAVTEAADKMEGQPNVCFCGVLFGAGAAADFVDNCDDDTEGMAFVRVAGIYPASTPGVAEVVPGNGTIGLGVDLELGIFRSIEIPEDPREALDVEAFAEATEKCLIDAQTMYRAISCCEQLHPKDYVLGTYIPYGPMGGVIGGFWPVSVVI